MSMLYYFFSIKETENAYLFQNLNISKDTQLLKHQNQYPVIFITLKDMKNNSFHKQLEMYSLLIQKVIRKNKELLTSKDIDEFDKERIINLYRGVHNEVDLQNALGFISDCLMQHHHKKVILLIDEQAVPTHGVMFRYKMPI